MNKPTLTRKINEAKTKAINAIGFIMESTLRGYYGDLNDQRKNEIQKYAKLLALDDGKIETLKFAEKIGLGKQNEK